MKSTKNAGVRTVGTKGSGSTRYGSGTFVTKAVGKGSHVVRTIVTPAGSFRVIGSDVLDRAKRSANTALTTSQAQAFGPRTNERNR